MGKFWTSLGVMLPATVEEVVSMAMSSARTMTDSVVPPMGSVTSTLGVWPMSMEVFTWTVVKPGALTVTM